VKEQLIEGAALKECDSVGVNRIAELGAHEIELRVNSDGIKPFTTVHGDTRIEDLSEFFPAKQIEQHVALLDAQSFIDYVNRYKTDRTLLFCSVGDLGATFKAILDFHGAAPDLKPGECEHTAAYATTATAEWTSWMANNRQAKNQRQFAEWLEDNAPLFVSPSGADLLELVTTLEGKSDVRFVSATRLQSGGSKLDFNEDVTLKGITNAQQGFVELPKIVKAGIAPFLGAPKYEVEARLKFRIESSKLTLWLETISPHTIVRDSVKAVVKEVADKTGIIPLLGSV
jgi:uncharacterized protein YfdQ (DUF2303 family)